MQAHFSNLGYPYIQDIQETMDKYEDADDNVIKTNASHSTVSLDLLKER